MPSSDPNKSDLPVGKDTGKDTGKDQGDGRKQPRTGRSKDPPSKRPKASGGPTGPAIAAPLVGASKSPGTGAGSLVRMEGDKDLEIQPRTDTTLNLLTSLFKDMQQDQRELRAELKQLRDARVAPPPPDDVPEVPPHVLAKDQAARAAGGSISGYKQGKALSSREKDLLRILESFSDLATAEELFRRDICTIKAIQNLTPETASRFSRNVAGTCHPLCPSPSAILITDPLIQKLLVFSNWIHYQPLIGMQPTASNWLNEVDAYERTEHRAQVMRRAKDSSPITTDPPILKTNAKFAEWDQAFRNDLRTRFNKYGIPLVYVIRPKDQTEVSAEHRVRSVGDDDGYPDWTEYNIRCAALSGEQFRADNQAVWILLCHAVRGGPGWEYIRQYHHGNDESTGDARAAYLNIYENAFTETNIDAIIAKTLEAMNDSKYSGDSRNLDFDQHCRNWLKFRTTLMTYGEHEDRDEKRFILNFFRSVNDDRLNPAKTYAMQNKETYMQNFPACVALFVEHLGITTLHHTNKRNRYVSAFVANSKNGSGGSKKHRSGLEGTYTGTIENKQYPKEVYATFSKEQRIQLHEMRQKSKSNKNHSVQAVDTNSSPSQPTQQNAGAGNNFGAKGRKKGKNKNNGNGNAKKDE